jgi:small-conductance mechanosensitive channel
MVLVRCPNSTVTADYQVGKVRNETVVANDEPNQKMSVAIERIARLEQHIKEQDALIQKQRDSLRASLETLNVMKDAKQ